VRELAFNACYTTRASVVMAMFAITHLFAGDPEPIFVPLLIAAVLLFARSQSVLHLGGQSRE
jgi:hypothetical protein